VSQVSLYVRDINVELHEVSVEFVVTVLQESVVLAFELLNVSLEFLDDRADVLQVVLFKRRVGKLIDLFSTIQQFKTLEKHNLENINPIIEKF
jgi:hypothetical protein